METATLDPPATGDETVDETGPDPAQEGDHGAVTGEELYIEGSGQLSLEAGGKAPTDSKLQVTGRSIDIPDGKEFKKGERITVEVEFEIAAVTFTDKRDTQTGQVVGCTRKHGARIVGFRKL